VASVAAKAPGQIEDALRKQLAATAAPIVDATVLTPSADGKKRYSAKVTRLADELCSITLLETQELMTLVKERLGLTDSALLFPMGGMGASPAAGAGAAAAAPEAAPAPAPAPPKEEKTHVSGDAHNVAATAAAGNAARGKVTLYRSRPPAV